MMKFRNLLILVFHIFIFNGYGNYSEKKNDDISRFIEKERLAYNIPSVVVGITNSDSIIYLKSFGDGDTDELYLIGSNAKSFTALALLMMENEGKIDLNEPVSKYLPWFRYHSYHNSEKVTVKDLLNHTSGIPRNLGMYEPKSDDNIQNFYTDLLIQVKVEEDKDALYEYSNLNYQLLGLIIEKVSDRKYSYYISNNVIQPLGLNTTFSSFEETKKHGLKDSYQYLLYYPVISKNASFSDHIVPSGFISSTAEDMCVYLRELLRSNDSTRNSFINHSIADKLFTPRTDIGSNYGMGWVIRNWKDYVRYKHDGLTQCFSSSMLILPELGIGIVIMNNINNSNSTIEMADGILRILTDKESTEYSKTGFYFRNSLPLFAFWVLIVLIFRIKNWIKLKCPFGINRRTSSNFWLLSGIIFGLFWVIYFPYAFNTPLPAIIDYEPNSGYSLIILSVGIILNSFIGYFIRLNRFVTN